MWNWIIFKLLNLKLNNFTVVGKFRSLIFDKLFLSCLSINSKRRKNWPAQNQEVTHVPSEDVYYCSFIVSQQHGCHILQTFIWSWVFFLSWRTVTHLLNYFKLKPLIRWITLVIWTYSKSWFSWKVWFPTAVSWMVFYWWVILPEEIRVLKSLYPQLVFSFC